VDLVVEVVEKVVLLTLEQVGLERLVKVIQVEQVQVQVFLVVVEVVLVQ
tara:strand:+ start:377 stop:523 length:147 start_codon:yes stop_codon:yes gene_type:complete